MLGRGAVHHFSSSAETVQQWRFLSFIASSESFLMQTWMISVVINPLISILAIIGVSKYNHHCDPAAKFLPPFSLVSSSGGNCA